MADVTRSITRIADADDFAGPMTATQLVRVNTGGTGFETFALDLSGYATAADLLAHEQDQAAHSATATGSSASTIVLRDETAGIHANFFYGDGSNLTNLPAPDLSGYVPTARTVSTTAPLAGGGALSGNLTLSITAATTSAAGSMSAADKSKLDGVAAGATANAGTVTSVAMTVPGVLFSVSGSPVTGSGTLAFSLLTQTANTFLAGPAASPSATPTMRAIVKADLSGVTTLPYLDAAQTWTAQQVFEVGSAGGSPVVVRKTGGSAGSDEVQLSHNGTDGIVEAKKGTLKLKCAGATLANAIVTTRGGGPPALASDNSSWRLTVDAVLGAVNSALGWQVDGTGHFVPGLSTYEIRWNSDAALRRSAAGLVCVTDADAGSDVAIRLQRKSTTTAKRDVGGLLGTAVVNTDATRTYRVALVASDFGGDREGVRVEGSGTATLLGFYAASAVAKQTVTGSRGANAALASVLTALASLGLITDSSS